jgi:hypothetical protein
MNTGTPKPSDVERLLLPLFMQESVFPLRSGPVVVTRSYGNVSLSLQGGVMNGEQLPIASGTMARRLMHYVVTAARVTGERKIHLGGVRKILKSINIAEKSSSKRRLKEELLRLTRTSITIDFFADNDTLKSTNIRLFSSLELHGLNSDIQTSLFGSWIEFSPEFFRLITDAVHQPVNKDAIWRLTSPLAIDVYLWLQRRCQTVPSNGLTLTWDHVYEQFGRGEQLSKFKSAFRRAVQSATAEMKGWGWEPCTCSKEGVHVRTAPQQVPALGAREDW